MAKSEERDELRSAKKSTARKTKAKEYRTPLDVLNDFYVGKPYYYRRDKHGNSIPAVARIVSVSIGVEDHDKVYFYFTLDDGTVESTYGNFPVDDPVYA